MNLEHELKAALERKAPSHGFADRVLAGQRAEHSRTIEEARRLRPHRAVAAAVLMTIILGGWTAREVSHQREGERARREVLTALRITTEKLRTAQQYVHDIGSERQ